MIQIICTNCKTELLLDDAFAGGVCRCQHCGAIQKVPANAKPAGTAPSIASMVETPSSLLVKPVRVAPPSPAGAPKKSKPVESPKESSSSFGLILGIAVGLLVVMIVLGILFLK
jgi:hypothetical protein